MRLRTSQSSTTAPKVLVLLLTLGMRMFAGGALQLPPLPIPPPPIPPLPIPPLPIPPLDILLGPPELPRIPSLPQIFPPNAPTHSGSDGIRGNP